MCSTKIARQFNAFMYLKEKHPNKFGMIVTINKEGAYPEENNTMISFLEEGVQIDYIMFRHNDKNMEFPLR